MQHKQVDFLVLRFDKLFPQAVKEKEEGPAHFIKVLSEAPDNVLNTLLFRAFVDHFYRKIVHKVKQYCFLPFVVYFLSSTIYISHPMLSQEYQYPNEKWNAFTVITASLTLAGASYFGVIELIQLYFNGLNYLKGPWNYIDIVSVVLNIMLVVN